MTDPISVDRKPIQLELEPGTYAWCACGRSTRHPFCDGSHRGTGLRPVVFELTERKTVALCACKHAAPGQPFCDGSHRNL